MAKNYWLHRITGGDNALRFSYPLLFNHNYLSIGWCDMSEDEVLKNIEERGIQAINEWMQGENWGLPRNRWNLCRFICEMKKGDIVIVPTQYVFSVFEIVDNTIYSNESIDKNIFIDWDGKAATMDDRGYMVCDDNKIVDLGFYRKVALIEKGIPRDGFADAALQSRMKIRQTNSMINDLKESVENSIKAYKRGKPINLTNEIISNTAPIILNKIRELINPDKFEDLVEWYLTSIGANPVIKPSKNESSTEEGDADRVAYFENIKTAIMVQIKKHDANTNDWAVQQIKSWKKNHDYGGYSTQMWVISTCDDFSEEAKREAESSDVRLINGLKFCEMILNAGLNGLSL